MNKNILHLSMIIGLCSGSTCEAQLATLDSKKILSSIPEMAKLDTLVINETQKYSIEYEKKKIQVSKEYKIADSLYKLKPKEEATIKSIGKAQQSQKELQEYEVIASKKLTEYKNLLYKPYIEKVNSAIKIVAIRRKYQQVIDIWQVALAYLNPQADITEEVIKEIKHQ